MNASFLTHPPQALAAQDVQVQVKHGLAAIAVGVDHHPVAIFCDTLLAGNFLRREQHFAQQALILWRGLIQRADDFVGHNQNVGGRGGRNIAEGRHVLILIHNLRRNFAPGNFCKNGVLGHAPILVARWQNGAAANKPDTIRFYAGLTQD